MKKDIKILSTVGPSSMNPKTIKKLDERGVDIFRINFSHTKEEEIDTAIHRVIDNTKKPLCLDLEGAQIRCGEIQDSGVEYVEGKIITIHDTPVVGDEDNLNLTPAYAVKDIKVGDLISIDFDTCLLQVVKREDEKVKVRVVCGGLVKSNKAVTVDRPIGLEPISEKDKKAIAAGLRLNVPYVALSFANRKSDVEMVRGLVDDKMKIISKIESKEGLRNLEDILEASDAILIDRGDMSREVSIEMIPPLQKKVIKKANQLNKPVYVATNLLETMITQKLPTRAEANDIINTLLDGADGLVLAAETAIGAYPVECVSMVKRLIKTFESVVKDYTLKDIAAHVGNSLSLVSPHGGQLVNRVLPQVDEERLKSLRKLFVDEKILFDVEQIATGGYSPVEGFMGKKEISSVLDSYKLLDGNVWTLPIVLQAREEFIKDLRVGDEVALVSERDNQIYAVLHLEDVYAFDFEDVAQRWYGTTSLDHPGVALLKERGKYFLGGKIDLVKRIETPYQRHTLTPLQTRHIFEKKGWNSIVGFHTRNVIHRAHEYLQLTAMDRFCIDGLFVHPIVGPKKRSDFHADIIMKSYEMMVDKFYPKENVMLGAFLSYSRYAGPREAVFTALCRKNFGCTHFIVGRDHTGVGSYYEPGAAHDLFDQLGDIGIKPVYFEEIYYSPDEKKYVEAKDGKPSDGLHISGTEAREMLKEGKNPPDWFMRREISDMIIDKIKSNTEVFVS